MRKVLDARVGVGLGAVVGGEDHEGVFGETVGLQGGEHAADRGVSLLDPVTVTAGLRLPGEFRRGHDGGMR